MDKLIDGLQSWIKPNKPKKAEKPVEVLQTLTDDEDLVKTVIQNTIEKLPTDTKEEITPILLSIEFRGFRKTDVNQAVDFDDVYANKFNSYVNNQTKTFLQEGDGRFKINFFTNLYDKDKNPEEWAQHQNDVKLITKFGNGLLVIEKYSGDTIKADLNKKIEMDASKE